MTQQHRCQDLEWKHNVQLIPIILQSVTFAGAFVSVCIYLDFTIVPDAKNQDQMKWSELFVQ